VWPTKLSDDGPKLKQSSLKQTNFKSEVTGIDRYRMIKEIYGLRLESMHMQSHIMRLFYFFNTTLVAKILFNTLTN
jgi:hypothetical protein